MEIVVTDLAKSREFYVDLLGLHVTEEDENTIYLRSLEEFIHHNLVLRKGPIAAVAAFAYRVKSPAEVDAAEAYYKELGCRTERRKDGFTKGIGDSVRVEDPLGFPYEFFYDVEHVERLTQRYDLYSAGELVRLDHFNQVTPDVPRGRKYLEDLGFRVSEDIQDSDGVTYAVWMHRKQTVHDTALTGGNGPRMHHVAFATHEKHNIIQICDKMGALRISRPDRTRPRPARRLQRLLPLHPGSRTATASRSTPRTTTPATRTTPSSPGTCTTTSAATGGATPWSRPGTPRPPWSWTSTATRSPSSSARRRARWP